MLSKLFMCVACLPAVIGANEPSTELSFNTDVIVAEEVLTLSETQSDELIATVSNEAEDLLVVVTGEDAELVATETSLIVDIQLACLETDSAELV